MTLTRKLLIAKQDKMIHQQQPLKKILIPKIHRVYVMNTRTKTILAFHQCARSLF